MHGKFRTREGGAAFPETFWYSLRELRVAGCSMADLRAAVGAYEEELAFASEEALCELASDDEDEGSEPGSEPEQAEVVQETDGAEADGAGPDGAEAAADAVPAAVSP